MKLVIIAALAACLLAAPLGQANAATLREIDLTILKISMPGEHSYSLETRKDLSELLNAYWKDFDKRIPRNSPTTETWLNDEMASGDIGRVGSAAGSREYALQQLYTKSAACVRLTRFLTLSLGTPREVYAWLKLLYCYNSPYGTMMHLRQAKLSTSNSYDGEVPFNHAISLHDAVTGSIANEADLLIK